MYEILGEVLDTGLRDSCTMDDRGDGVLLVFEPTVSKVDVTEAFTLRLGAMLRKYAKTQSAEALVRMRIALNAGDITHTGHGWSGRAVNTTFRLVDAAVTRDRLRAASDSLLVAIVSDQWYEAVVRDEHGLLEAGKYEQVRVTYKEVDETAWLHLLGAVPPPHSTEPPPTAERSHGAAPRRPSSGVFNFHGAVTVQGDLVNEKIVYGR